MKATATLLIAIAMSLLLAGCEKDRLDQQVKELCAKDGGVRVYETVKLSPEKFDRYGTVNIPSKQNMKSSDEYYFESHIQYFRSGNPSMWKLRFSVYRRLDNKLLGEANSYARRGGDVPGPWHPSSFGCPENADISDLKKQIFIRVN